MQRQNVRKSLACNDLQRQKPPIRSELGFREACRGPTPPHVFWTDVKGAKHRVGSIELGRREYVRGGFCTEDMREEYRNFCHDKKDGVWKRGRECGRTPDFYELHKDGQIEEVSSMSTVKSPSWKVPTRVEDAAKAESGKVEFLAVVVDRAALA